MQNIIEKLKMCDCSEKINEFDENLNLVDLIELSYNYYKKELSGKKFNINGRFAEFFSELNASAFREEGYEHIVKDDHTKMKAEVYVKKRMTTIPILNYILKNCIIDKSCPNFHLYSDRKGEKCIFCDKYNYLIVLKERKNIYKIHTGYPVTKGHKLDEIKKIINSQTKTTHKK